MSLIEYPTYGMNHMVESSGLNLKTLPFTCAGQRPLKAAAFGRGAAPAPGGGPHEAHSAAEARPPGRPPAGGVPRGLPAPGGAGRGGKAAALLAQPAHATAGH